MGNFDPTTGGPISKKDAEKKANKWKAGKDKKKEIETNASFIGRDWIQLLLDKPNCTGIWVNYGESDDGKSLEPFFTASDENGNPISTSVENAEVATDDIINHTKQCPPECP